MTQHPRARLELDDNANWRGPLKWLAIGAVIMLALGVVLFVTLSGKKIGDAEIQDAGSSVRDNQGP